MPIKAIGLCLKQHLIVYKFELGIPYILHNLEALGFLKLSKFKIDGIIKLNLNNEHKTSK
jgi:hypothetical protein